MDLFPKFIIEDDCLILAKVHFHYQLVNDKTKVKGGGWFSFDSEANTFVFYGDSTAFGAAKLDDIKKCINAGKVFTNRRMKCNISHLHKFVYKIGAEYFPISQ